MQLVFPVYGINDTSIFQVQELQYFFFFFIENYA